MIYQGKSFSLRLVRGMEILYFYICAIFTDAILPRYFTDYMLPCYFTDAFYRAIIT